MSHNSLFGKVEALMRKHRGESAAQEDPPAPAGRKAPAPDAWLPVLTDVVQRCSPPPVSAAPTPVESGVTEAPDSIMAVEEIATAPAVSEAFTAPVEIPEPVSEPEVAAAEPASVAEPVQAAETAALSPAETDAHEQATENLVDELTPKISGLMQEQVAEELRKSLNQSMASLMANLNANVEEIVRQALAEKLAEKDKKPN